MADVVSGKGIRDAAILKINPQNRQQVTSPPISEPPAAVITVDEQQSSKAPDDFPPLKRSKPNQGDDTIENNSDDDSSTTSTSSRKSQLSRDESSISAMVGMLDDVYVISPAQLEDFLKTSRGLKRPAVAAVNYTTDADGLISMITAAMKHARTYNLKRRLERTIKSVQKERVDWPSKTKHAEEAKITTPTTTKNRTK